MASCLLIDPAVLETGIATTVLGFCTVFAILCVICVVLVVFGKIMNTIEKPQQVEKKPEVTPVVKEEVVEEAPVEENLMDDKELIAVITAAIAASMGGNVTPDKLVVRSLNRVRVSSWKNKAIYDQQINHFKG